MTDKSNNNERQLTEDEVDQLLTKFYPNELPAALENLPSTWPEVRQLRSQTAQAPQVTIAPATSAPNTQAVPTASRGIAVAVATLAACLMLMLFSNMGTPPADSGTVETDNSPSERIMSPDATFNVSDGGATGAVDENGTNLQELDQIDLAPPKQPEPKHSEEEK